MEYRSQEGFLDLRVDGQSIIIISGINVCVILPMQIELCNFREILGSATRLVVGGLGFSFNDIYTM